MVQGRKLLAYTPLDKTVSYDHGPLWNGDSLFKASLRWLDDRRVSLDATCKYNRHNMTWLNWQHIAEWCWWEMFENIWAMLTKQSTTTSYTMNIMVKYIPISAIPEDNIKKPKTNRKHINYLFPFKKSKQYWQQSSRKLERENERCQVHVHSTLPNLQYWLKQIIQSYAIGELGQAV